MTTKPNPTSSKTRDITVLVPTYKRPSMLRSCLQSIAMQSCTDRINTVLVSENSDDDRSDQVAREFAGLLPITYVQHRSNWTAQEHGIWLANQANTKYVAQIADDDMWARYHLEEAIRCFNEHPSICAYFGQAIVVENVTCHPLWRFSGSFLQIPESEGSPVVDFRIWDQAETAINCMANTPTNIWAVVALADAHRNAIESSAGDAVLGQYPSNDRLYIWRLALQGNIGIGRNISLFYRWHAASDIQRHMNHQWHSLLESDLLISKEIARQAYSIGIDAFTGWRQRYQTALSHGLSPERIDLWNPEIKAWLLDDAPPSTEPAHPSPPTLPINKWKKVAFLFCPPILLNMLRAAKSIMKSKPSPDGS